MPAEDFYKRCLLLAETRGMRPLVAHCHLGLGRLHCILGEASRARDHLESALAMYREMDMHTWPEQAEAALEDLNVRADS